jgi:hypothetical protein
MILQHDRKIDIYTSAFIVFAQFLANLSSAKGDTLCAICSNNGNEQGSENNGEELYHYQERLIEMYGNGGEICPRPKNFFGTQHHGALGSNGSVVLCQYL